jgi:DNA-binding NarL/FixJ family response regulator
MVSLFFSDLVEEYGFDVLGPASSVAAARRLVAEKRPDIALVDVSLASSEDGVDLAIDLSASHDIAIIFLSGHSNIAASPDVQRARPVAVLQKPCFPDMLEAALREASRMVRARGQPE